MDRRVKKVVEIMEENFHREQSLSDLSRLVNLSESRLRHLFTKEVGMTPARCLRQLRMRKAKDLAANTFLNEKQVMREIGISDKSHFLRDFKTFTGVTFSKFRAHHHGEIAEEVVVESEVAKPETE